MAAKPRRIRQTAPSGPKGAVRTGGLIVATAGRSLGSLSVDAPGTAGHAFIEDMRTHREYRALPAVPAARRTA